MKRLAILAVGAFALGLPVATTVLAQSATEATTNLSQVTFDVPDMTCALCPVTVKAAMSGVDGVQSVEVNFDARTAQVVFDPAVTDAAAIAQASEQAGYPALVKG